MKHELTVDKGKRSSIAACERKDLFAIVSGCIKASMKGRALDPRSVEMHSLLPSIRSLGTVKDPDEKMGAEGH